MITALGTVAAWPVIAITMSILTLGTRGNRALPRDLLMTSVTQMGAGGEAGPG